MIKRCIRLFHPTTFPPIIHPLTNIIPKFYFSTQSKNSDQTVRQKLDQARKLYISKQYQQSIKIFQQIKTDLINFKGSSFEKGLMKSIWWMCLQKTGTNYNQSLPLLKDVCEQFDKLFESGQYKTLPKQNIDMFAHGYQVYASRVSKNHKEESCMLFDKVVKIFEQIYTPSHKFTQQVKSKYASILDSLNTNPQKVYKLYDEAYQAGSVAQGMKTEQMLRLRVMKAIVRAKYQPLSKHQQQLLQLMKDMQENLPQEHVGFFMYTPLVGQLHQQKRQYLKALKIYQRLFKRSQKKGPLSPDYNQSLYYVASCLQLTGNHTAAEKLIKEQLVKLGQRNNQNARIILTLKWLLVNILAQEQKFSLSVEVNLEIMSDIPQVFGTKKTEQYLTSLNMLVTCYEKMNQLDKALEFNQQLYDLTLELKGEYEADSVKFQRCILNFRKGDVDQGRVIRDELKEFCEEMADKNEVIYKQYLRIKEI